MPTAVKRRYESPRRREQARATRRAVLDAARGLFVELGYAATSVAAIASRAGVAAETVYAAFKNKRSVLSELLDVSIVGDDASVPLLEREWVQQMRDERDPRRRLDILARNGTLILARIAPVYEVLRSAASVDPEIATLWERYKAQRFEGQRILLGILLHGARVRPGLTKSAGPDILFTIGSPETYSSLVRDRGWSSAQFERWYKDSLARLLLA
jgi:TetR/AcrR family transcriptional regulator of autoinduction and epiphytic fitness